MGFLGLRSIQNPYGGVSVGWAVRAARGWLDMLACGCGPSGGHGDGVKCRGQAMGAQRERKFFWWGYRTGLHDNDDYGLPPFGFWAL